MGSLRLAPKLSADDRSWDWELRLGYLKLSPELNHDDRS